MKKHISLYPVQVLLLGLLFSCRAETSKFTSPVVTKITDGYQFVEGPVWVGDTALLFSDIPANTVYIWTREGGARPYMDSSGNSNGLNTDREGRLILCQHGLRQVAREEKDGSLTSLASHYQGMRLNSPNDLALHSDGSVFFTDPPYGLTNPDSESELGYSGIFRLSPSGDLQLLDSTLNRPNGIAFSPDERILYVTDSEARRIFTWEMVGDTAIARKKEFAYQEPFGYTDGMKVDEEGYIYSTGPGGVWIYSPDGTWIQTIEVPGQTTNCAFGEDGNTLFVTSGDAVYTIKNE